MDLRYYLGSDPDNEGDRVMPDRKGIGGNQEIYDTRSPSRTVYIIDGKEAGDTLFPLDPGTPFPDGTGSDDGKSKLQTYDFELTISSANGSCSGTPCVEVESCRFDGWLTIYVEADIGDNWDFDADGDENGLPRVGDLTPDTWTCGGFGTGTRSPGGTVSGLTEFASYRISPDFSFQPGCGGSQSEEISAANMTLPDGWTIGAPVDDSFVLRMGCNECKTGTTTTTTQSTGKNHNLRSID